jgi:hypothetical protein
MIRSNGIGTYSLCLNLSLIKVFVKYRNNIVNTDMPKVTRFVLSITLNISTSVFKIVIVMINNLLKAKMNCWGNIYSTN